jgi:hypothetical protein
MMVQQAPVLVELLIFSSSRQVIFFEIRFVVVVCLGGGDGRG